MSKHLENIIHWREKHISEKQLVLILSLFVGIATAIASLLLKGMISGLKYFVEQVLIRGEYTFWYLISRT